MTFEDCRICPHCESNYEHGGIFLFCGVGAKMHIKDCGWPELTDNVAYIESGKLRWRNIEGEQ